MANITDEQLAALAQAGDLQAEEYLIRKYKEMVRLKSQFYYIIGADGDDVVQEGMIGLFKAIQSFEEEREASFKTFAELCVNRQIITAIKSANRQKHSPLNESVSLSDPASQEEHSLTLEDILRASHDMEPEEELLYKDLLEGINSNQQKIFSDLEMQIWNRYLAGKNYREIAVELGKSPKSVDNAIQRTKRKIMDGLCQ